MTKLAGASALEVPRTHWHRWSQPLAIVIAVAALAACGGGGSTAASTSSSSSSSRRSSSSSSKSSSSASSSDTRTPALVACDLFDLSSLNDQTGLVWTVSSRAKNDACTITSDDGSAISLGLSPTSGQNDAALSGGKDACDTGTTTNVDAVDGGYVCEINGVASAAALFKGDNVLVVASSVSTNGASATQVENGLVAILKSFVAPAGAATTFPN